jgi:hypothetical protein
MTPFEYLITLVSVLAGLALADLATSLHKLLRARERVRWDWAPLLASLLAVLTVLQFWWALFGGQDVGAYGRIAGFLPLMAQMLLLYLLNAAALPDSIPQDGVDLRKFYEENARYFWLLFAGYVFLVMAVATVSRIAAGQGILPVVQNLLADALVMGAFLWLAFTRRRAVHAVLMILCFVVFMASWWGLRLEG